MPSSRDKALEKKQKIKRFEKPEKILVGKDAKFKDKWDKMDKKEKFLKDKEKDQKNEKKDKEKDVKNKKEKASKKDEKGKNKMQKAIRKDVHRVRKKEKGTRKSYAHYIHRVLKTVHPHQPAGGKKWNLSIKAMAILDCLSSDLCERLTTESILLTKRQNKRTLSSFEVKSATALVLPGELAKHAMGDGAKAVANFVQREAS